MKISDVTKKDVFKVKLTGEPIFADMQNVFDFVKLVEMKLLVPVENSDTGMVFNATHPLIIRGLGLRSEYHLRENDKFSIKVT